MRGIPSLRANPNRGPGDFTQADQPPSVLDDLQTTVDLLTDSRDFVGEKAIDAIAEYLCAPIRDKYRDEKFVAAMWRLVRNCEGMVDDHDAQQRRLAA